MHSFEPELSIATDEGHAVAPASDLRSVVIDTRSPGDSFPVPITQPLSIAWSGSYLLRQFRTSLPLLVSDQIVLLGAVGLSNLALRFLGMPTTARDAPVSASLSLGMLIACLMAGLYPGVGLAAKTEVARSSYAISFLFGIFTLAALAFQPGGAGILHLPASGILCLIGVPLARQVTRRCAGSFRWWSQPVLIFGDGLECQILWQALKSQPQLGLMPLGIFGDIHVHWHGEHGDLDATAYLGPPQAASEILSKRAVDRAIVVMPEHITVEFHRNLAWCASLFPHITVVAESSHWKSLVGTAERSFGERAAVECQSRLLTPLPHLVKRIIDVCAVVVISLLVVPLMCAIAVVIKCTSKGPIFFSQERIGRSGRPFRLWKFRTMLDGAESVLEEYLRQHPELRQQWETEHKLDRDPRLIPGIGCFLRKSSLDELPQLWNVWMGDMSLVGPRPLPRYHLDKFAPQFRRFRERVTPGITGLWQVASRSNGSSEMFVKFDSEYIVNWSLLLDLQILLRTIKEVLLGTGAS